jgi:hypothetical protein
MSPRTAGLPFIAFAVLGFASCTRSASRNSHIAQTPVPPSTPASAVSGSLDGTWEGDLTFLRGATLSPKGSATLRYRITIEDSAVHVYIVEPQEVREIKRGALHIERLMSNAVISAIESGKDDAGTWVETLVITVTRENGTTLLANLARQVNNIDLPQGSDDSKFTKEAAGELQLIPASSP